MRYQKPTGDKQQPLELDTKTLISTNPLVLRHKIERIPCIVRTPHCDPSILVSDLKMLYEYAELPEPDNLSQLVA